MNPATIVLKARLMSPTCRDAARRYSESMDHDLGRTARLGVRIHLVLCRSCARYRRQIDFLENTLCHLRHPDRTDSDAGMPAEVRSRIAAALSARAD